MNVVKATKLKRGDKIAISGTKYTITKLTLHFGGKRDALAPQEQRRVHQPQRAGHRHLRRLP